MSDTVDSLKRQREKTLSRLNARIAQAQRVEDNRLRKEDTRYKIVFGACLLADLALHPDLKRLFETSLKRNATPRDAEFLRTKGWDL